MSSERSRVTIMLNVGRLSASSRAVTIEDQSASRRHRTGVNAVAIRRRAVIVVIDDLQVKIAPEQQRGQQQARRRQRTRRAC
jgi:hypothetical protein